MFAALGGFVYRLGTKLQNNEKKKLKAQMQWVCVLGFPGWDAFGGVATHKTDFGSGVSSFFSYGFPFAWFLFWDFWVMSSL